MADTTDRRITELEQTLESLREDSEVAHVLLGLAGVLAELRSVEETLDMAVRVVSDILGADRAFAATRAGGAGRFKLLSYSGFDAEGVERLRRYAEAPDGLPLFEAALTERTPLLIPDVAEDGRIGTEMARERRVGAYIGLPLVRWGEDFGGIALEFAQPHLFTSKELALSRGIARQVGQALVNARRFNLLSDLRDFGQRIAPMLSQAEVIRTVGEGSCELLSGDAAAVYVFDGSGKRFVASPGGLVGFPPDVQEPAMLDATDPQWSPLTSGATVEVPHALNGGDDIWSAAGAPFVGPRGSISGAIVVFFNRAYGLAPDEVEALSVLAGQAAMSLENSRRFEREHQRARALQRGLLTPLPEIEDCDVAAVYDPASGQSEIGGDFYDAFDLPDGKIGVVVGDVSGKGAEAAARLAMAKYMLRAFAIRNPTPSSVLFHLNNALVADLEDERFATLVYGLFDPKAQQIAFGIAGHPPPLIYRHDRKEIETIELGGSILGAFEDIQYEQATYHMAPEDLFLAFTDGLIEARSADGKFYGRKPIERGLVELAPHMPCQELVERMLDDAKTFGTLTDDTVIFALRCRTFE